MDDEDLNYYRPIFNNKNKVILYVFSPNYAFIKIRLRTIFNNQITQNSKNLKVTGYVAIKFKMIVEDDMAQNVRIFYFNSNTFTLSSRAKVEDILDDINNEFEDDMERINSLGSGAQFDGIIKIETRITKSKNIYGGSFIELSEKIKLKRVCVNIVNK